MRPTIPSYAVLVVFSALMACSSDSTDPSASPVALLEPVSGLNQDAWPGGTLPNLLVVQARDAGGATLAGVTIEWSVEAGGGALDRPTSVTGPDGIAVAGWMLGNSIGEQRAVARSGLVSATFTARAGLAGDWERVANLLYPVRAPAVATDGARIYVFGGSDGGSLRTRHTQIYDPALNLWTAGADLPQAVEWSTAVYAEGRFHLMGGVTNSAAAADDHWIYDSVLDTWASGASLPTPAAGSASGLIDGEIIVAAGIEGPGAYSSNVHRFRLATNEWVSAASTPKLLINWQAAVINGAFYAAGGSGPGRVTSSSLYRYDPALDEWTPLEPMLSPNEGYAGTQFLGLYCVLGGRTTPGFGSFNTPFDRFECYDPSSDDWLIGPQVPYSAQEMGAASLDGSLYAIGGRPTSTGVTGLVYRIRPGPQVP